MNYLLRTVLTLVLMSTISVSANAALSNATFNSADNGCTMTDTSKGLNFDLQAGQTNLNWDKFNVGKNETVNFNFNAANSTAFNQINKVNGVSEIAGSINATGVGAATSNIILNNAAGVSFINGSMLNVGAMTVQGGTSNLSIEGLTVNKGNLNLETAGRIDIRGVNFKNKGNITATSTGANITLGEIYNAGTIQAQTSKGIYVKEGTKTVGGRVISGITSDYIKLASTKGGKVNVEGGRITVGKDFLILTQAQFVDGPGAGVNEIVTKNGKFYCIGYGGSGSSDITNATIVNNGGIVKIFARNLNVENSNISNLTVSSFDFVLKNSRINNNLDIALDGTHRNDTPTTIISSYINNMNMEFSTLGMTDTTVNNLHLINVNSDIANLASTRTIQKAVIDGGKLTINKYNVKELTLNDVDTLNTTISSLNIAAGSKVKTMTQTGGSSKMASTTIGTYNGLSDKSYASGSVEANDSTINNFSSGLYNVTLDNTKITKPATFTAANTITVKNMNGEKALTITDGSKASQLVAKNSDVNANNFYAINCVDTEGGKLNLTNSRVAHHLIMNDTNFKLTGSTVAQNIYFTKSLTNNDIIGTEIEALANVMTNRAGNLYIGYTPAMGNYQGLPSSMAVNYKGNVYAYNTERNDLNLGRQKLNAATVEGIGHVYYGPEDIVTTPVVTETVSKAPVVETTSVVKSKSEAQEIALETTIKNYVNTLKVNTNDLRMETGSTSSVATQFAKNARSMAVDNDKNTKRIELKALDNGFHINGAYNLLNK